MSRTRTPGVCLFCEYGLTFTPPLRRVRPHNQSRPASTTAGPRPSTSRNNKPKDDSLRQDVALSPQQLRNQIRLATSADVWRRSLFGPHTVQRGRGITHRFLAYQERLKTEDMSDYASLRDERRARRSERQAAAASGQEGEIQDDFDIENEVQTPEMPGQNNTPAFPSFIRLHDLESRVSSPKISLQLLKSQLRSCTSPEDFTHVVSVVLDTRPGMPNADGKGARLLGNSSVQRIISRSLARYDARRALLSLSLLIRRLTEQEQEVDVTVLRLAIETACRSLSLIALPRYMQMYMRATGNRLSSELLLSILTSLKAGCQANTRELIARRPIHDVLYSVSLSEHSDEPLTLRSKMGHIWAHWKIWIDLLVACRSLDSLRAEWSVMETRTRTRTWRGDDQDLFVEGSPRMFMKAFFDVDSPQDAWKIFEKYGDKIQMNDKFIWERLMDNAEDKPTLPEDLQKNLEVKIIERLSKGIDYLEKEMGIKWVPGTNGEEGHHEVIDSHKGREPDEDDAIYLKEVTKFAVEREEEILAQKDDILAGKHPRPYREPFT